MGESVVTQFVGVVGVVVMGRYRLVDVKEIELGIGFFVKTEKEAEFSLE